MIALDTNILVYAHREDSEFYPVASRMGPLVHDARVAAICLQHGIRELWSSDRDFGRFPRLQVLNPLTVK